MPDTHHVRLDRQTRRHIAPEKVTTRPLTKSSGEVYGALRAELLGMRAEIQGTSNDFMSQLQNFDACCANRLCMQVL